MEELLLRLLSSQLLLLLLQSRSPVAAAAPPFLPFQKPVFQKPRPPWPSGPPRPTFSQRARRRRRTPGPGRSPPPRPGAGSEQRRKHRGFERSSKKTKLWPKMTSLFRSASRGSRRASSAPRRARSRRPLELAPRTGARGPRRRRRRRSRGRGGQSLTWASSETRRGRAFRMDWFCWSSEGRCLFYLGCSRLSRHGFRRRVW